MEIILLTVNKTKNDNLKNLLNDYKQRIAHYIKFSTISTSDIKNSKNLSPKEQKEKEGVLIQKYNANCKRIVFVIGSPYGFLESIYRLKNQNIFLS